MLRNFFRAALHVPASTRSMAMTTRTRLHTFALFVVFGFLALVPVLTRFLMAAAQANTVAVLSSASYEAVVAPDSVATAFGVQLATTTAVGTDTDPNTPGVQLPTTLGGTSVEINGRRAGLFFVSPTQINLLIPPETTAGVANVRVVTGNGVTSTGTVLVGNVAPAIFTANADGRGVPAGVLLRVRANGAQSFEQLFSLDARTGRLVSVPIDLGPEGEQVYLVLFATGVRRASDANGDGNVNETVRVVLAGLEITPQFVGRVPGLAGLDQANVLIPRSLLGRGKVTLSISAPGANASNVGEVEIAGVVGVVPPQINGFNMSAALVGQTVTIQGNNFAANAADNLVRIGDLEAPVTAASTTQLTVIVPFGAESAPVSVRTLTGESRSSGPLNLRTSVSGVVETTARQPLSDVTVQITSSGNGQTVTTRTGTSGVFVAADVPTGLAFMKVIGSSIATAPALDTLTLLVTVNAGRDNQYSPTIYLQPSGGAMAQVGQGNAFAGNVEPSSLSIPVFAPEETEDAAQAPTRLQTGNVSFELPADAAVRFPNGATRGLITLTQVESSRVPVRFPEGVFSTVVVQLTPFGTTFNPGGKLSFPNPDGYAAGSQVKLFKLDQGERSPNLGHFVEVGTATVSNDGQRIETGANAITETSYYFVALRRQTTTVIGRALDADRTPVRRALIRARGQEEFTDGNGGFIIRNVPVFPGNDTLSLDATLVRATGRVERLQRTGIPVVKDGTTMVAPELVFGSATANQLPYIIAPDNQTANAGQTNDVPIFSGDPDNIQPVNLTVSGASFASIIRNITLPHQFTLRLTPALSDAGTRDLTLVATDNQGGSTSRVIHLTVVIPNRAPVANNQSVTTDEDTPKQITLAATDADNNPLTYMVVTPPAHGALTGTAPNLTYTPALNYNGSDSFTFKANDGALDSNVATITLTINPVNDAPVLTVPGPQTVKEGETLTFTISATDVDTGQTLTFSAPTLPSGASFNNATRTFSWTPGFTQAGTHTAMFAVLDNGTPPKSDAKSVTITVTEASRAPVANVQSVTTNEDTPKQITLTGSDPDGNQLTFMVVTQPAKGSLSGTAPNLTYTPNKDVNGTDSFTFKANDGQLDSPPATISITINPVNDAPVATPQQVTTDEDTPVAIKLAGADVDGDVLSFAVVTQPAKGTLSGTAPNLTYTPNKDVNGTDTFTFKANDGKLDSATATVTITIRPVNDAPVANPQSVTTEEDTPKQITLAGSDVDGDALTFAIVIPPTKGTLTGTAPNLTYTPNKDNNGADSFTFKANDGKADSAPATVNITINPVNDAPVATPQQVTTDEDKPVAIKLAGTDVDGDTLTFMVITQPTKGTLSGTAPNLTYTPNKDVNGTDTFTFKANDSKLDSAPATVTITVRPANDPPVATPQSVVTDEGVPKQITLAGTDLDGDRLTFMIVTPPAKGTLSGTPPLVTYTPNTGFNGADSFTFKVNDGTVDSPPVTVAITVRSVNHAPVLNVPGPQTVAEGQSLSFTVSANDPDVGQTIKLTSSNRPTGANFVETSGLFTWTPGFDQAGTYTVTFGATDNGTPPLSDSKTVTITVTNTNRAPSANAQTVTTEEDKAVPIVLTGADPDGDAIALIVVAQPLHGTLTGTPPNLTYTPAKDFNGSDSFTFKANDNKLDSPLAVVTINITPVNDPPSIIVPGTQDIKEGQALSFQLTATDVDAGQTFGFTATNLPNGATLTPAGLFNWTPGNKQAGTYNISFTVTDNGTPPLNNTKSVTINVTNPPPVATSQTITLDEDTPKATPLPVVDPDGDALTYTIINQPQHGALSGTAPNLTYTPALNYNGPDSFTFKANDGVADSNVATISLVINPVNDAPILNVPPMQTVNENQPLSFSVSATDVDTNQTLTFTAANVPSGATFNAATRTFSWTPTAGQRGSYTVNFTATDNGTPVLSDTEPVKITVAGVNRPPVANNQSVATDEDMSVAFTLTGSDPDNDTVAFFIQSQPQHGTLTGSGANRTYTPNKDFSGQDSFTFFLNDNAVNSPLGTVTITVRPINDAPVLIVPGAQTVNEGQALNFTVSATDVDAGQTITFSATGLPPGATLNPTTGAFAWTPNFAQSGAYDVVFTATDNGTPPLSNSKTVHITVNDANGGPTADNKQVMTDEDTPLQITLSGTDPQNDPLTFAVVTQPQHGTLTGTPPSLTYTPALNYNGPDSFTYKANDGKLDSNVATVSITVKPINDAPVTANQAVQVTGNTPKQITLTATDVDNDPLTFMVVTQPTKGMLTGTAPNLTYTPNQGASGPDSFTYKANDGKVDSNVSTVNITISSVNSPPVATPQNITTDEDTSKQITLSGTDPDNNPLTFMVVTQPTKGTLSGNAPNLLYLPNPNVNGSDSFTFKVNDGTVDSAVATVNITISPINDPPALAVPGAQMVDEGVLLEFTVSATDVDAGQTLTFSATNLPTGATFNAQTRTFSWAPAFDQAGSYTVSFTVMDNGTPQLSDTKTVAITVKDAVRGPAANPQSVTTDEDVSKPITLTGSDPDGKPITFMIVSQPAHGTLTGTAPNVTYVPTANYNGPDSFTFKVNNGMLDSNTATVSITVNPVNDAPSINAPDSRTANEGEAISFTVTGSDIDTGQTLTFSSTALPTGATFNTTTGAFAWTPAFNQAGSYSITFTVTDNGTPALSANKTTAFTINDLNRVPTANNLTVTTDEDVAKAVTLTGSDPDNDTLTFMVVAQPMHGALTGTAPNLTYTPALNYNGPDSFTYKANDGKADSANATVTITVNPVNDAPVLTVPGTQNVNAGQAVNFTVTASDVDTGQTVTLSATNVPSGATFNPSTGAFSWPSATVGVFNVNFTATDNGTPQLSDNETVQINVGQTNQAPTCSSQNVTADEDTPKQITLSCTDPNGNPLTYMIVAQPAHGAVALNGTTATYTPAANYNGADSFTFKANDGSLDSATTTISITVNPVCDAPVLTVPGAQTVATSSELVFTVTASDTDGGTLTLAAMDLPTGATFTPNGNTGEFRWTPASNFPLGTLTVTFKVTDDCAPTQLTDTKTVNITVTQGSVDWTQTPGPEGGKITAIAVGASNTIFVGTIGGGVFRSTNNGDTWAAANTGLINHDVTALVFRNGVLYAGTAGDGVFRSTDNGVTWSSFNTSLGNGFVFQLAANDTHLFAAAATTIFTNQNVFRTPLNEANWSAFNTNLSPNFFSDMLIAGTKIFVSTFTEGVFASPTDTANWTDFNNGLPSSGAARSKAAKRAQSRSRASQLAVDVRVNSLTSSGSNIYAATDRGVFASPLSAANWTAFSTGLNEAASIIVIEAIGSTLFARAETLVFDGSFNTVYEVLKTPVAAANWTNAQTGIANRAVNVFASNGSAIFAGSEGSGVYRTTNDGANWSAINSGLVAAFVNTLFVKGNLLFAGTDGGGIFVTSNNGQSWTEANNGLTGVLPLSVTSFALNDVNIYAGTNGRGVYRTTNDGATWSAFNNETFAGAPVKDLVVSDNKLFAAAGDLGLFSSSLDTPTWAVTGNLPALVDITTLFKTASNLFVGTGAGSVYRSDLTGASWTQVGTGLTNTAPVTSFALRGTNLFVGRNGDGVYRSTDNGDNFTQVVTGLTNQSVTALRSSDPRVYAATNGGGVFVTSNDGTNWTQSISNLTNLRARTVIVKDNLIFVGTEGSGVFSRPQ